MLVIVVIWFVSCDFLRFFGTIICVHHGYSAHFLRSLWLSCLITSGIGSLVVIIVICSAVLRLLLVVDFQIFVFRWNVIAKDVAALHRVKVHDGEEVLLELETRPKHARTIELVSVVISKRLLDLLQKRIGEFCGCLKILFFKSGCLYVI